MKTGTYKHYKGKYYQVIGIAKHSETMEEYVTYYCLYHNESGQLWVRPKKLFEENVIVEGKMIPRFEFVKQKNLA